MLNSLCEKTIFEYVGLLQHTTVVCRHSAKHAVEIVLFAVVIRDDTVVRANASLDNIVVVGVVKIRARSCLPIKSCVNRRLSANEDDNVLWMSECRMFVTNAVLDSGCDIVDAEIVAVVNGIIVVSTFCIEVTVDMLVSSGGLEREE